MRTNSDREVDVRVGQAIRQIGLPLALFAVLALPAHGVRVNNLNFHLQPSNLNALGTACYADDLPSAKKLINPYNINKPCADASFHPIHVAAMSGKTTVLEYLLKRGARVNDSITASDFRNLTPLHLAAAQTNPAMARLLLDRGARINEEEEIVVPKRDEAKLEKMPPFKVTPYDIALFEHNDGVIEILRARGGRCVNEMARLIEQAKFKGKKFQG